MRKLPIFLVSAIATIAIVGGVMASSSSETCNYDEEGNYHMPNGTVSAFGTMNSAMHCASLGLLPDVISRRLGLFGGDETKAWADDIKLLNQEVIERKEKKQREEIKVETLEEPEG